MIKDYRNGNSFLTDYSELLSQNIEQTKLFLLDAKSMEHTDIQNYIVCAKDKDEYLVSLKTEPYSTMFYGSKRLIPELIDYLIKMEYGFERYLCEYGLGRELQSYLSQNGIDFNESLSMDDMECTTVTEPDSDDVEIATEQDVDEVYGCLIKFFADCNLVERPYKPEVKENIRLFRLIRVDGKIVSFAKISQRTEDSKTITCVYTRDEYRGKGYASRIVNTCKNEIIVEGKKATLVVDKNNPVSSHIYYSLGFLPTYSISEYRKSTRKVLRKQ